MELLHALLMMDRGDDHAAGVDPHHLPGRKVRDGDEGLAQQLLRLIGVVDAAQDHPVGAGAVVQNELQQLLALGHSGAVLDLDGPEVGLGKGLKVHEILEEGLDLHLGEIDLLVGDHHRLGPLLGLGGGVLLIQGLHGGEYYLGIIVTSHKFL